MHAFLYHVFMEKGIYLHEVSSILPGERWVLTEKMELVLCDSSCSAICVAIFTDFDSWNKYTHISSWLPNKKMLR